MSKTCEDEVVAQLVDMSRRAAELASRDGRLDPDEFFIAEQNARVVKNAERYYRSMFSGRISSWNLRDRHMAETLDHLISHLGPSSKIVVWAHNSHLGDARATEVSHQGELNVGQLIRQKYGNAAVLIGFTTYTGTVTAASNWDGPAEQKQVRPALNESFEAMLHGTYVPQFLMIFRGNEFLSGILNQEERLERAIGVIYLPQSERASHYFHARLADQFDALIHIDNTNALQPLEITSKPEEAGEVPETYPSAV
jgi:erythromycin esterase-like protein